MKKKAYITPAIIRDMDMEIEPLLFTSVKGNDGTNITSSSEGDDSDVPNRSRSIWGDSDEW